MLVWTAIAAKDVDKSPRTHILSKLHVSGRGTF
jgi:hypothetical protein